MLRENGAVRPEQAGPERQEVPRENGAVEARAGCAEQAVPAAAEGARG